jgi:hypothetical protein
MSNGNVDKVERLVPGVLPGLSLEDRIVQRVCEKLVPMLEEILDSHKVGVLVGAMNISKFLGLSDKRGNGTLYKWYKYKGLPMQKSPSGDWFASKEQLIGWMRGLEKYQRTATKLGIGRPDSRCIGGMNYILQAECHTPEQRFKVFRKIMNDDAERGLKYGKGR